MFSVRPGLFYTRSHVNPDVVPVPGPRDSARIRADTGPVKATREAGVGVTGPPREAVEPEAAGPPLPRVKSVAGDETYLLQRKRLVGFH